MARRLHKTPEMVGVRVAVWMVAVAVMILPRASRADDEDAAIQLGLLQPIILRGGNVEVDYHTHDWSFDYSHGFSLEMGSATAVGQQRAQHLAYHLPYSTGLGVGLRVTRALDLRIEPKIHAWEVFYDGDPQTDRSRLLSYKTFTLGVGAYHRWCPLAGRSDWSRGLTVTGSVRFWPTIWSTMSGGVFHYENRVTGKMETLEPAEIGIANTPLILNVSVGYTFGG